jgi:hypothetical protein
VFARAKTCRQREVRLFAHSGQPQPNTGIARAQAVGTELIPLHVVFFHYRLLAYACFFGKGRCGRLP